MAEIAELTEAESFRRGIYCHTVGGIRALADPLKVLNRIYEALPNFDDLAGKFFGPPVEGEDPATASRRGIELIEAATAIEPAVLAAFRLQPLGEDGSGVSTTEAMALLSDFLDWQDRRNLALISAAEARAAARAVGESAPIPSNAATADEPAEAVPTP